MQPVDISFIPSIRSSNSDTINDGTENREELIIHLSVGKWKIRKSISGGLTLTYSQLKMVNQDQKKKILKTIVKGQKCLEMELMVMMTVKEETDEEEH